MCLAFRPHTPSRSWPLLLFATQRCCQSTPSYESKSRRKEMQNCFIIIVIISRKRAHVIFCVILPIVPTRSVCSASPTSPSWPCFACICWRLFLVTSLFTVRNSKVTLFSHVVIGKISNERPTCITRVHTARSCVVEWGMCGQDHVWDTLLSASPCVASVESELLHTYSRIGSRDVLILCVRLAVLVAVTLTVPVVLFPVRYIHYIIPQRHEK